MYNGVLGFIALAKMSGLVWSPIFKASLKPLVMNKAVFSPFWVNKLFVATVVPITTSFIFFEEIAVLLFLVKY